MTQEAVINVRLDTKQAKDALKELDKEGEGAGRRAGDRLRDRLGRGARSVGLGAIGGVIGATGVRAAASGGLGAVLSEGLGDLGAQVGGAVGQPEARASERAREATIQAFQSLGRNANNQEAATYYEQMRRLFLQEELGRNAIEKDMGGRFRTSDTIVGAIRQGAEMIIKEIRDASTMTGGGRR